MIFLLLNLFSQGYLVLLRACRARSLLKRNMDRNLTAGGGGERFEGQGGKQKGRGERVTLLSGVCYQPLR
jgi:hypothetical protein